VSENAYPPVAESPVVPAPQPKVGNGFGIASLVLGIVTMVGFAIPFLNFATIATGVIGAALGVIGLVIKFRPRKAALVGVILSGLGLILSIILIIVYTAAFAGAVSAIGDRTVAAAGGSSSASPDDSAATSFKDGVLTTSDMKIEITEHKIIPVGQPGNEYGDKPVIAFYYTTTNLTDKEINPSTAWILDMRAFQDNNPNAENELQIASLPDEKFLGTQLENIKQGGSVQNAVAYSLDDLTTPVDLVASENLGITKLGKMTYEIQ